MSFVIVSNQQVLKRGDLLQAGWIARRRRSNLVLRFVPNSLVAALWVQFAQAKFCTNACRFKAYRTRQSEARALHEQGVSVEVAARTLERYSGIMSKHLAPALGNCPLAKLQPLEIQAYYSQALENGVDCTHPAEAVEPPRPKRKEIEPMDEPQTAWLIEAAAGTRPYVLILLAVTTGRSVGKTALAIEALHAHGTVWNSAAFHVCVPGSGTATNPSFCRRASTRK